MKLVMAGTIAALALLALGGSASGTTRAGVPAFDQTWLQHTIQGDRAEVTTGLFAEQRAKTPQVRALAAQLVGNHRHALDQSIRVARQLGIEVPTSPAPTQQWLLGQMKKMTVAQFERFYTAYSAADHQQEIKDAQEAVKLASVPAVQKLATTAVPMLKVHLLFSRLAYKAAVTGSA
jgi:putative membrane protein